MMMTNINEVIANTRDMTECSFHDVIEKICEIEKTGSKNKVSTLSRVLNSLTNLNENVISSNVQIKNSLTFSEQIEAIRYNKIIKSKLKEANLQLKISNAKVVKVDNVVNMNSEKEYRNELDRKFQGLECFGEDSILNELECFYGIESVTSNSNQKSFHNQGE